MSTISAGTTSTTTLIHSGDTTGSLVLKTNDTGSGGTTAVTIDTSQNVGIGQTSPASKLDVNGNIKVNNQVYSAGDLILDAVFSTMIKKSGSTNATINQFGIGLAGSNLSSGTGIAFPATQSASSDANTLDDYEEGTFTPTFTPGAGAFTTVSVTGAYTKIGRFVNVYMTLSITTVGTASGALTYSGLPFTNANSNRHVNLVRENGTTGIMGQTWIDPNATTGTVRRYDDASYTLASGQNYLLNLNYYTT